MNKQLMNLMKGSMLAIVWVLSQCMYAQGVQVTGRVTDAAGEPLIGATVQVQGTSGGTVTDIDGNFFLNNVPSNGTLTISYVGMQQQNVPLAGRNRIEVIMMEDAGLLEEIVVVGYGGVERRDLTSAVSKVSSNDFLQGAVNNPCR